MRITTARFIGRTGQRAVDEKSFTALVFVSNPLNTNSMEEIWKDIKGFEGLYQVSNLGRVRGLDRIAVSKRGWSKKVKGEILTPSKHHYGYLQVSLTKNGKGKSVWIHSLVARAFIPNPYNLPQVNHKDENKTNNRVENLEWCTCGYNANYGTRRERLSEIQRNDVNKSKKVAQLDKASGTILRVFPSVLEASRMVGISDNSIRCVANKKPHCFTAGGYGWAFV